MSCNNCFQINPIPQCWDDPFELQGLYAPDAPNQEITVILTDITLDKSKSATFLTDADGEFTVDMYEFGILPLMDHTYQLRILDEFSRETEIGVIDPVTDLHTSGCCIEFTTRTDIVGESVIANVFFCAERATPDPDPGTTCDTCPSDEASRLIENAADRSTGSDELAFLSDLNIVVGQTYLMPENFSDNKTLGDGTIRTLASLGYNDTTAGNYWTRVNSDYTIDVNRPTFEGASGAQHGILYEALNASTVKNALTVYRSDWEAGGYTEGAITVRGNNIQCFVDRFNIQTSPSDMPVFVNAEYYGSYIAPMYIRVEDQTAYNPGYKFRQKGQQKWDVRNVVLNNRSALDAAENWDTSDAGTSIPTSFRFLDSML